MEEVLLWSSDGQCATLNLRGNKLMWVEMSSKDKQLVVKRGHKPAGVPVLLSLIARLYSAAFNSGSDQSLTLMLH